MDDILFELKELLQSIVNEYDIEKVPFLTKHSFRVLEYSKEIVNSDFQKLDYKQRLTLFTAVVFHDVGSLIERQNHCIHSSDIFENNKDKVLEITGGNIHFSNAKTLILNHSDKHNKLNNDLLDILCDADILDQIGAMSILEIGSKYEYSNLSYFNEVLKHLEEIEIPRRKREYSLLRCKKSKMIMNNKINYLEGFKKTLLIELEGDLKS